MTENLRVGIAIPTYNREEVLIETIEYVIQQDLQPLEILVVDQSEEHTEQVKTQLAAWHSAGKIRYIPHYPPGLPGARNRALRETKSDILIFIDDDVTLEPTFARSHLNNYYKDPELVAVAGRVVQRLGYPKVHRPEKWPRILDFMYFKMDGDSRTEGIANFQGGNHSARVSYVRSLGGYDEGYKGVALREETDLALRIFLARGKITYDPSATLFHIAAPSGGCRRKPGVDVSAGVSAFRFYWKFNPVLRLRARTELWRSLRLSLFTKSAIAKPYLLPVAASIYAYRVACVMLRVNRIKAV
jgi:GT2 family glycosyltransferase